MKSIAQRIKDKGVTKFHVAAMVGIAPATLSRIISGEQTYVSEDVMKRINTYLDRINTDDKKIFENN